MFLITLLSSVNKDKVAYGCYCHHLIFQTHGHSLCKTHTNTEPGDRKGSDQIVRQCTGRRLLKYLTGGARYPLPNSPRATSVIGAFVAVLIYGTDSVLACSI